MSTETAPVPVADGAAVVADAPVVTAPAAKKKERKPRKPRQPREPKEPKAEGEAADSKPEEEDNTFKVFVGNLAFTTTSEELTTFCAAAGPVVKVEIITRGTRSLGYGFVSYNTEEEAQKAVTLFDKQELAGRQINVEVAKLREPGTEAKPRGPKYVKSIRKGGKGLGRGRRRSKKAAAEGETTEKRVDDDEAVTEGEGAATTSGGEDATGESKSARGKRGRGRGRGAPGPRRRFPKAPRDPKPDGTAEDRGPLSETMLFVANLPFKVTDDDLKSIFKDYKVTTAKVVRLKSGKSKGFGFVEVESHEEQQRVLTELKNVVVDSRELVVKVALAAAVQNAEAEVAAEETTAPAAEETKA